MDQLSPGPFPSWDDFRFFLATSKAGSFSKAASEMGVTQPTISRRVENLEHRLGVRLFDRLPNGVALTAKGESILDAALHIENTVLEIQRNVHGADKRMEGAVRISVTDGLATYWMTPRLLAFQEKNPGIGIEFQGNDLLGAPRQGHRLGAACHPGADAHCQHYTAGDQNDE